MAKVNFGLALYGRGYTLSDPGCHHLQCPYSGPSQPGNCTDAPGVMSQREIEDIMRVKDLAVQSIDQADMKQITWDNQWMGYDDVQTHAAKLGWAEEHCFGGSMYWSLDFQTPKR